MGEVSRFVYVEEIRHVWFRVGLADVGLMSLLTCHDYLT